MTKIACRPICDNCGISLVDSSSTREIRGFRLCKLCREIEEELYRLGEKERELKLRVSNLRAIQQKSPCHCRTRNILALLDTLHDISIKIVDTTEEFESLKGRGVVA